MLRNPKSRRLRPEQLADDKAALDALKTLTDYAPQNPTYAVDGLTDSQNAMLAEQALETQMRVAWENQRDRAVAAEHKFHDDMIGSYDAVKGQYGRDSAQVQAMGRKRVSEYKRPARKKATPETSGG
jgi:hypothetical protein